jgi:succinate-acetate transporter protein
MVFSELGWIKKANSDAMVAYFIMWGLFTLCMFIGTLKRTQALQLIFGSLTVLFFLLAIQDITLRVSSVVLQLSTQGLLRF